MEIKDLISVRKELAEIGLEEMNRIGLTNEFDISKTTPDYFLAFDPLDRTFVKHFEPMFAMVRYFLDNRKDRTLNMWLRTDDEDAIKRMRNYIDIKKRVSGMTLKRCFEFLQEVEGKVLTHAKEEDIKHDIAVIYEPVPRNFIPSDYDKIAIKELNSIQDIVDRSIIVYRPRYYNVQKELLYKRISDLLLAEEKGMVYYLRAIMRNNTESKYVKILLNWKSKDPYKIEKKMQTIFRGGVGK